LHRIKNLPSFTYDLGKIAFSGKTNHFSGEKIGEGQEEKGIQDSPTRK